MNAGLPQNWKSGKLRNHLGRSRYFAKFFEKLKLLVLKKFNNHTCVVLKYYHQLNN